MGCQRGAQRGVSRCTSCASRCTSFTRKSMVPNGRVPRSWQIFGCDAERRVYAEAHELGAAQDAAGNSSRQPRLWPACVRVRGSHGCGLRACERATEARLLVCTRVERAKPACALRPAALCLGPRTRGSGCQRSRRRASLAVCCSLCCALCTNRRERGRVSCRTTRRRSRATLHRRSQWCARSRSLCSRSSRLTLGRLRCACSRCCGPVHLASPWPGPLRVSASSRLAAQWCRRRLLT